MNFDDMALVGRVARAHGVRGQVIVNAETDFPDERFRPGTELLLRRPGGQPEPITLTSVRFHRGRPIIGIRGVDDMNAATALSGAEIRVPVAELQTLPAGTYYRHDLVGCVVQTEDGVTVGEVVGVEGSLTRSRLVVRTECGEALIPLADEICRRIDPAGKRIVIRPPAGLIELNQEPRTKDRNRAL